MEIIILVLLTLLNCFFALSELSIISVNKSRIAEKAQHGSRKAQTVQRLLKSPEDLLSAIQVGITLIGIITGAYGGAALSDDASQLISRSAFLAPYADTLAIVLVVGVITYFSIVVGELIPKSIALANADAIALTVAPVISLFALITRPLVRLLSGSTSFVTRALGVKEPSEEKLSAGEIRQIIKTAGKQGVLAKDDLLLHQNIFTFSGQRAKNLRTHRMEVEYVNINQPLETIKEVVQQSGHSKFPVVNGSIDNVVGILTAKRFYEYLAEGAEAPLMSILQEPIYVPETMLASAVLNVFKRQKQYLGIVVDEYGTMEGIITLHDILEAIVGDLPDMEDIEELEVVTREDGSLLINGSIELTELNRALRHEVFSGNSDHYATLAGFIVYTLGRMPATGDKLQYEEYELEVVDMDGHRVDKVLLKKLSSS